VIVDTAGAWNGCQFGQQACRAAWCAPAPCGEGGFGPFVSAVWKAIPGSVLCSRHCRVRDS